MHEFISISLLQLQRPRLLIYTFVYLEAVSFSKSECLKFTAYHLICNLLITELDFLEKYLPSLSSGTAGHEGIRRAKRYAWLTEEDRGN